MSKYRINKDRIPEDSDVPVTVSEFPSLLEQDFRLLAAECTQGREALWRLHPGAKPWDVSGS